MKFLVLFLLSASLSLFSGGAYSQSFDWTQYFSEEQGESRNCNSGIRGLQCDGKYCDSIRLGCTTDILASQEGSWSNPFSEERPNNQFRCPTGQIATALKCEGSYCDNLSVKCAPAEEKLTNCSWSGWISEEQGPLQFPTKVMAGLECNGKNCDNKRVYTCNIEKAPAITVGDTTLEWVSACEGGQNCKTSVKESIDIGRLSEKSWSEETRKNVELSISATAGYAAGDAGGAEASTTVTATAGTERAKSKAGSLTRQTNHNYEKSCEMDVDFTKYDIHAVWQIQTRTEVQGQPVKISTCVTTCTPDAVRPTYGPGSPEDIGSCLVERRANPTPTTVTTTPTVPPTTPAVTSTESPAAVVTNTGSPTPTTSSVAKGATVQHVDYAGGGNFERVSGSSWVENSTNGAVFNFQQVGHDEWSVYLQDESRGIEIAIDLWQKKIKIDGQELYKIIDAK